MLVNVTTDNHIRGREELVREVETSLTAKLSRFAPQIMRVEVHLADENSHKGGDTDKTCTLEARLAGLQPLAATASGASIDQAVGGALDKLIALLDHKLGRLHERKNRSATGEPPGD
jgi:ribosome-associated translation inhibitor RaiA